MRRAGNSHKLPAHEFLLFNEYLRFHCTVVDADVVEKTGEAGPGLHHFAGANVKIVACIEQTDKLTRLPTIVSSCTCSLHSCFLLQGLHECDEVLLFPLGELGSKYQIEKLHRVVQSKEPSIV